MSYIGFIGNIGGLPGLDVSWPGFQTQMVDNILFENLLQKDAYFKTKVDLHMFI